eukprot:CAMPEP_0176483794 /NCGR_PEP_ID=MMETSP0200_2-20121128/4108_1 /TAXON_ID=947934 /ORGANISM="Chaetoceros sp., Strain GSL56" /LENGTH=911 /DNA_ID=CAMNT_0017880219 /DNA_START=177 /DNA_END=2909 /DNA_ORIENTATION=+
MGRSIDFMLILVSLLVSLKISFSNGYHVVPTSELSALNNVPIPPQCVNGTTRHNRYTSLICWLWDLELSIPDDTFRKGLVSVTIKDMTCTNFQINSTSSEYLPGGGRPPRNSSRYDPKLNLLIYGVSTICTGNYEAGFASGTLSVLVQNFPSEPLYFQTSINSTLIQHGDTDIIKVPSGWNVEECKTNLEVPKDGGIYFSGSFSAKLIGLFSKPISRHVTSTINSDMCPRVQVMIENTLTNVIHKVVKVLEKLIFGEINNVDGDGDENTSDGDGYFGINEMYPLKHDKSEQSIPHALPSLDSSMHDSESTIDGFNVIGDGNHVIRRNDNIQSYSTRRESESAQVRSVHDDGILKWTEMASLEQAISGMSSFVNNHLDEGIFLKFLRKIGWFHDSSVIDSCTDCGHFFRGVNGLLKNVTQNGHITWNINKVFDFTIASLGEVSICVKNTSISGVDNFSRLEFMPREPNYIIPSIALNNFGLSMNVDLKVVPTEAGIIHGNILEEAFNLSIVAKDLALELMMEIVMMKDYFLNMTMHDLFHHNYSDIWNSLSRLLLTQPESKISVNELNIDPSQCSDSLEVSFDALLNNVFRLILTEYDTFVSRTLQASFNGPVLESINRAIDYWIRKWKHELLLKGDTLSSDAKMFKLSDDFFRFNQSKYVQEISAFFSSEDWMKHMNDFILCVSNFVRDNPLHPERINHTGINVQIQDVKFEGIAIDDIDVMKSADYYHVDFGVSANRLGYCDKQLALNLIGTFDYPEEELNFVTNLNILSSGIRATSGVRMLYNTSRLETTALYEILKCPSALLTPLMYPSGIYGLGSVFDYINISLDMELYESGRHRSVSYASGDSEKIGELITSYISVLGLTAQNILNGLAKLHLLRGKDSNTASADLQVITAANPSLGTTSSGKFDW